MDALLFLTFATVAFVIMILLSNAMDALLFLTFATVAFVALCIRNLLKENDNAS